MKGLYFWVDNKKKFYEAKLKIPEAIRDGCDYICICGDEKYILRLVDLMAIYFKENIIYRDFRQYKCIYGFRNRSKLEEYLRKAGLLDYI